MWWPLQLGPGAASPTACPVGPEGAEGLAGWQDPRPPECAQHSGPEAPGQSLAGPAGPAWIPARSSQGGPPAAPSPTQPRPALSPLPHAAPPRTQLPSLTLPLGLSLSSLCSVKEQQQGQGRGLPQGPRGAMQVGAPCACRPSQSGGHNPGFRSKRLNQGPCWPRVFRQCSHSRLQHLGVVVRGDSVLAGNSTERPLHPACGPGQGHPDTPTSPLSWW